ncbi:pickpocket protein 28-like isoform X2 [Adelges cooleyi]|uniref:pickpocket protein 28-like isoform X2 n=1 Tax=Adelges cooleyi TaxID=133065 RepID=UPI0021806870|nr:pickpocket protein 28-like isoform X2 [Adelges cooleyi]
MSFYKTELKSRKLLRSRWPSLYIFQDFEPYRHPVRSHGSNPFNNKQQQSRMFSKNNSQVWSASKLLKKKKKGSRWRKMLNDYSLNTTLHGLRYAGNNELSASERGFWIISFCLAVITAVYFIFNLVHKWNDMPVIISLSPKATQLTSIPFPAITICNMNNARKSVAQLIMETSSDYESNIDRRLLSDFCDEDPQVLDSLMDNHTGDWESLRKFMIRVSQPCHEMVITCLWASKPMACSELFNPSLTDEGICCSFNRLKAELIFRNPKDVSDLNVSFPNPSANWTPEHGYPPNTPAGYTPWRPWGAGNHLGLTVVLDAEIDEYYCSSEVMLHSPVETPKISSFGSFIAPGRETAVEIRPSVGMATPTLASIPREKRQCVYSDEKRLRFYRTYTQRNCMMECEANFTLMFCQCVMYYMPKDSYTRICGKRDEQCSDKAKLAMELRFSSAIMNMSSLLNGTHLPNCTCLPGCHWIGYNKVQSSSPLSNSYKIKPKYLAGRDTNYFKKNMAVVHYYFEETQFTGYTKGELFGFTEFLSNTGGLLGLFMGFSFLSAVEIIYFITLRLWCSISKKKKINTTK